jgi:O-antigen/teichoic acid export membrane protein
MQHIGRNIFSLILSRVISGIILFLIYTKLIQYLGPDQAGQYGLLSSYLTVFSFFVDIGMSQLVIKKISEDREHAQKYLNNYFFIQLALALAFTVIMAAFVFFADYPAVVKLALYVTSLSLFATSASLPFRAVVIAFQKLTFNAYVNFWNSMINAAVMYLTVVLDKGIVFLSFTALIIGLFDFVVYGWVVHKRYATFKFEYDKAFIKQLFIWNIPFTLLTLFSIYNRVDGLLLPHLRNFTENGYYSAAYKIWDTLAFVPGLIGISLYPFFSEAMNRRATGEVKKGLETYTRYMIAIGIPMSVGVFVLAKPITLALFGTAFLPAVPAVWLLVMAVSVLFIYTPANSLIVSHLTKTATKITGFTLLFNIVANLIFIPTFGFVAAAVITLLCELFQMVNYTFFIKKDVVRFAFFRNFVKPIVAAAAMAAFLYFFHDHNLWLTIAAGGIIYAVVLLALRFFHAEDFELFKAAIRLRNTAPPSEQAPPVQ